MLKNKKVKDIIFAITIGICCGIIGGWLFSIPFGVEFGVISSAIVYFDPWYC
jgi:hypothetical protein